MHIFEYDITITEGGKIEIVPILICLMNSELEESLLVLPFSCVTELLPLLRDYIQAGSEVELVCRCLLFLLRYGHKVLHAL